MPSSVTIVDVIKGAGPSDPCIVHFSDGISLQFPSLADMQAVGTGLDSDLNFARKLAVALWLGKDPNASNINLAKKTYTLDMSDPSPIKIQ